MRSILLSGYKPGSPAMRLEKVGDTFRPVAYQVYGPKVLSAIANLPEALASRCIRVGMFRAAPDSPKPRRRLDAEPGRWQLYEERAAIREYDGGQAREHAEAEALTETIAAMRAASEPERG